MEGNVVLSDKVDECGFRVEPKILPFLWLAQFEGPFLGGGDVTYRGVEPDVEDFAFGFFEGDGDAPV